MALLHLLCGLQQLYRWKLNLLHFNHRLRSEAEEEADFVRQLASGYGLPFFRKDAEHLRPGEPGIQGQARHWRRKEALVLHGEIGADRIVTAHHADDQVETWLLKWLRGAHLSGLQGMSWQDPPFIRPLLGIGKEELKAFLKENSWNWCEDSSNLDPKYLRNRVRHELIPLLRELSREGLETRIGNLDEQSRLLEEDLRNRLVGWDPEFQDASGLDLESWRDESELLRHELLYRFITTRTGIALSYEQLKRILALLDSPSGEWIFHLEGGWILELKNLTLQLKFTGSVD